MTPLINFAIGMAAIFLFVSLFVSTIQELVAQALALRARYLRLGIIKLLEKGKADLGILGARLPLDAESPARKFFENPLIQALGTKRPGRTSDPSYVSKETFVSVASQLMGLTAKTPGEVLGLADSLKADSANGDGLTPLQQAVAVFAQEGGGDLQALRARLGEWFDETMDRVGGAYKRWTQIAAIVIGFIFAIAFNIDSIVIAQWLFTPEGTKFADSVSTTVGSPEKKPVEARPAAAPPADATAAGAKPGDAKPADAKPAESASTAQQAAQITNTIVHSKVPFGWKQDVSIASQDLRFALLGWILTALAASFGSAFWFDTLRRFVSIRSSGDSPDEKKKDKNAK